jgi:hypothetical protein
LLNTLRANPGLGGSDPVAESELQHPCFLL